MEKRINWIDHAKFFSIFLVILGHSQVPESAVIFIYSFHMPLFFFISGFLFDPSKFTSPGHFIKRRTKQLIVPYFLFNIITYLFWLFVGRKFGNDVGADICVLTPVIGMFYGTDTGNYLIHCGSLWFLPCLFLVEIMYYFVQQHLNKWLMVIIFGTLGYINFKIKHVMLPWSFDVALIAMVFYIMGNIWKDKRSGRIKPLFSGLTALLTFFALLFLSALNGRSDMSSNTYNNYFLFILIALVGIGFLVSLSILIESVIGKINWVEFFARNTIILLAFHTITASILKGILLFALHIPIDTFKNALGINVLLTIATFIVLAPVIVIIDKYLPFLLGRGFKSQKVA